MDLKNREPFNKKEFAKRLTELRKSVGQSKKDFAFTLGYGVKQYSKFEDEDAPQTPSLIAFNDIVQLTSTSPGYLLSGIGPKYIDIRSARKLTAVMNAAIDINAPNFGVLAQQLIGMSENQLQLLIDLVPVIKGYDPELEIRL